MKRQILTDIVRVKVHSLSNGDMRIEPFYDTAVWQMAQEYWQGTQRWYGYPGLLSRMSMAVEIERLINRELANG